MTDIFRMPVTPEEKEDYRLTVAMTKLAAAIDRLAEVLKEIKPAVTPISACNSNAKEEISHISREP